MSNIDLNLAPKKGYCLAYINDYTFVFDTYTITNNKIKTKNNGNIDIKKITPAGNTSLQGALNCIASRNNLEEMQKITKRCTVIDLGGNPKFNERFMENMYF